MEHRVRYALGEVSTILPQMSNTPKDHKPLPASGVPKSRPLCDASATINSRVSDLVSDILSYMFMADDDGIELFQQRTS